MHSVTEELKWLISKLEDALRERSTPTLMGAYLNALGLAELVFEEEYVPDSEEFLKWEGDANEYQAELEAA